MGPNSWHPILKHYYGAGMSSRSRQEWHEKERLLLDMVRGEERFWSEGFMNLSETPVEIINRKTGEVVRKYMVLGEYYDRRQVDIKFNYKLNFLFVPEQY